MKRKLKNKLTTLIILLTILMILSLPYNQPNELKPNKANASEEKIRLWKQLSFLRGANIYSRAGMQYPIMEQDFIDIKNLGANLVQLSFKGTRSIRPPYKKNKNAISWLDGAIQFAEQNNLYVTIAIRTGPGRIDVSDEFESQNKKRSTIWTKPKEQLLYGKMWQEIAKKYKNYSHVIGYNLLVEPNPEIILPDSDKLDVPEQQNQLLKKGVNWHNIVKKWVKMIRRVDRNTPIIIQATGWSNPSYFQYLKPINDPYIVYDVHMYEPFAYTHQEYLNQTYSYPGEIEEDGEKTHYDKNRLAQILSPVFSFQNKYHVPIIVGEFGVVRWAEGAEQYLRDSIELFESYGWNHSVWAFREGDRSSIEDTLMDYELGTIKNNFEPDLKNPLILLLSQAWKEKLLH